MAGMDDYTSHRCFRGLECEFGLFLCVGFMDWTFSCNKDLGEDERMREGNEREKTGTDH